MKNVALSGHLEQGRRPLVEGFVAVEECLTVHEAVRYRVLNFRQGLTIKPWTLRPTFTIAAFARVAVFASTITDSSMSDMTDIVDAYDAYLRFRTRRLTARSTVLTFRRLTADALQLLVGVFMVKGCIDQVEPQEPFKSERQAKGLRGSAIVVCRATTVTWLGQYFAQAPDELFSVSRTLRVSLRVDECFSIVQAQVWTKCGWPEATIAPITGTIMAGGLEQWRWPMARWL